MHIQKVFYSIFLCFFYGQVMQAAEKSGASIVPAQLTCEYRTNPLGVDQRQPRLGWLPQATNCGAYGQRQRAYRILVATDSAALVRKKENAGIPVGFNHPRRNISCIKVSH
ncbi:hypothetical protein KUH03_01300 [Sphingobacterium sp. E70]|uniref:glycoside hydrolase family 78 protein n=1 Tax=Sphingobacterium sp. E70 TaxID=2853439 RepID=UPI00211BDF55|nr:hypothetical protein [Sphingobacterium sp. E70]ULT25673.1 hypothetical protein KUH03_01300 [Sphingobacterium sp. E70]